MTGSSTMSTVVIYAETAKTFWQLATLIAYGLVVAPTTAVCFSLAQSIAHGLGKTGTNVMSRLMELMELMGLILAARSVKVKPVGLVKLYLVLAR